MSFVDCADAVATPSTVANATISAPVPIMCMSLSLMPYLQSCLPMPNCRMSSRLNQRIGNAHSAPLIADEHGIKINRRIGAVRRSHELAEFDANIDQRVNVARRRTAELPKELGHLEGAKHCPHLLGRERRQQYAGVLEDLHRHTAGATDHHGTEGLIIGHAENKLATVLDHFLHQHA